MPNKKVVAIILTTMLTSVLTLTLNIQPVKALGIVYIRADGSIDPPTAPIYTGDNVTYTLTSDINFQNTYYGIVIQRDNIVVDGAGHTITGDGGPQTGIQVTGRSNVTIQNTKIWEITLCIDLQTSSNNNISGNDMGHAGLCIALESSTGNTISKNHIQGHGEGIWLGDSSSNSIVENNLTGPSLKAPGIRLEWSTSCSVVRNRITEYDNGITILSSSGNTITENNLVADNYGIYLAGSGNNVIYHNNFENPAQTYEEISAVDIWDNGYPSGGNYWSDYTGPDLYSGPFQNETGSDGIGDTPYIIDYQNLDHYPLMNRWLLRDVAVTGVVPNKTVVGQGYSMNTSVTLANQGESTETFNVSTYVNTSAIETREITLTVGNSSTITVTWNTTGFSKGNYTISAVADTVTNEFDTEDNTGNFTGIVKVTIPGDADGDFKVTMGDINLLLDGFGSTLGPDGKYWSHPPCIICPHSPNCDIDSNGRIDMADINYALDNFGKHYP